MAEPITVLTASVIAQLAFSEFIKSGAGELAKKSLSGAIDLVNDLRKRIRMKFQGNSRVETVLAEVEQQGTSTALDKMTKYLDIEMDEDDAFATELRQIAQQIVNVQNQNATMRQYNSYGRDQINIENIQGNPKIGGS
jgi:hypothetical protein